MSNSDYNTGDYPRFFTRKEAAEYLRVAETTLAVWASTKEHKLPYVKIGRRALYRLCDLEAFVNANMVEC